jgi:hypothetical protein
MEKKRITVYVPPEVHKKIKRYCIDKETNVSEVTSGLFKLLLDDKKVSDIKAPDLQS